MRSACPAVTQGVTFSNVPQVDPVCGRGLTWALIWLRWVLHDSLGVMKWSRVNLRRWWPGFRVSSGHTDSQPTYESIFPSPRAAGSSSRASALAVLLTITSATQSRGSFANGAWLYSKRAGRPANPPRTLRSCRSWFASRSASTIHRTWLGSSCTSQVRARARAASLRLGRSKRQPYTRAEIGRDPISRISAARVCSSSCDQCGVRAVGITAHSRLLTSSARAGAASTSPTAYRRASVWIDSSMKPAKGDSGGRIESSFRNVKEWGGCFP